MEITVLYVLKKNAKKKSIDTFFFFLLFFLGLLFLPSNALERADIKVDIMCASRCSKERERFVGQVSALSQCKSPQRDGAPPAPKRKL